MSDSSKLWLKFTDLPTDSDEYRDFENAAVEEKAKMLRKYANDTDDSLWRSKEWMSISGTKFEEGGIMDLPPMERFKKMFGL